MADKHIPLILASIDDATMLLAIWNSIWAYDDGEEVCMSNDIRNELEAHLRARQLIA